MGMTSADAGVAEVADRVLAEIEVAQAGGRLMRTG
jgi:hypothetical protein